MHDGEAGAVGGREDDADGEDGGEASGGEEQDGQEVEWIHGGCCIEGLELA